LKQIPNGVDTDRFHPVTTGEKATLRDQLGLPKGMKLILFVGHFSREKYPDILLKAWKQSVAETLSDTGLIFVGSTYPYHYEVDAELVRDIRHLAEPYIDERIFFIEMTHEIEKVYQAADIFVLPSLREGMPNALLEAMACSLPVIVSKLEGVTDWVVMDGKNGLLVESGIRNDLGKAIKEILNDDVLSESLGREARRTVVNRFSMQIVAKRYDQLYGDLVFR
jgi:glycosyltransferase involved in cell wall biosynthesis